jgi:hypothetical protein
MLVVSENLVLGASVHCGDGIDPAQDLLQRFSRPAIWPPASHPIQTFRQGTLYRFRDRFTSLLRNLSGEPLGRFVLDAQGQKES